MLPILQVKILSKLTELYRYEQTIKKRIVMWICLHGDFMCPQSEREGGDGQV